MRWFDVRRRIFGDSQEVIDKARRTEDVLAPGQDDPHVQRILKLHELLKLQISIAEGHKKVIDIYVDGAKKLQEIYK